MEYQINRLPGSVLIPLGDLPESLGELDGTRDLVVYCHHGIRSVRAVEFLRGGRLPRPQPHGRHHRLDRPGRPDDDALLTGAC